MPMTLTIKKEPRGLHFKYGKREGWLKDTLFLPDLVHELKPDNVEVLT